MLDAMGKRYGLLPSEILRRADTLDLHVFDMSMSYQDYAREKAETGREPPPKLSQDQMAEMLKKVKGSADKS